MSSLIEISSSTARITFSAAIAACRKYSEDSLTGAGFEAEGRRRGIDPACQWTAMDPFNLDDVFSTSSCNPSFTHSTQQHTHPPLTVAPQQTQQQPVIPFNPSPASGYVPTEQTLQLELLRETRRIRELELRIAEERRKERDAEVLLGQLNAKENSRNLASTSTINSSAWTPHALIKNTDSTQLALLLDAAQAQFTSSWFAEANPQVGRIHDAWFEPSVDDVFNNAIANVFPPLPNQFNPPDGPSESQQQTAQDIPGGDEDQSEDSPGAQPSTSTEGGRKRPGKIIQEKSLQCAKCGLLMGKMILRGSREELDVSYDMVYRCLKCEPSIPSTSTRKRTNEMEDTNAPATCDVCSHMKGHGGFVAKERATIMFIAELVCLNCSEKYKRCTNCGGTSARGVIGKWRCKELFSGERKTCSLSHVRLGTVDMEMAVWEIPTDLQDAKELPSLIDCCEQMWREHVLSRLAVPEMLEHQPEIQTFADIEQKVLKTRFFRSELFTRPPRSPDHRRFVSFSWAKVRTRRDKSKPEWARTSHESKRDDQWLTYNMRRSTVLHPTSSMLSGVWMVEWVIPDRTFFVTTLSEYESATVERGVLHISEILRRVLATMMRHNAERPEDPWLPPEHLWIMNTSARSMLPFTISSPLPFLSLNLKEVSKMLMTVSILAPHIHINESLQRRSILPLNEYLARHASARKEMFTPDACALAKALAVTVNEPDGIEVFAMHMNPAMTLEGLNKQTSDKLRSSIRKARSTVFSLYATCSCNRLPAIEALAKHSVSERGVLKRLSGRNLPSSLVASPSGVSKSAGKPLTVLFASAN
ncbi:hypothetical protein EW146_g5027 [Bondarzewia mesenterica]|uniref:Uncharacterized protein n=1 Tax=Bondarzewia mesenterica TaxID=1095465 RepID=A0A4S4LYH8_9AGAM|nr:hypothetical protein EW146_g5027 [Bondarzewia mesenterica]